MSRHHLTPDEFNVFWAMIGAVVLIPAFIMWMLRRLERESQRESWRQADIRGRIEARNQHHDR
jgi:hypothetical protein